MTEIFPPQQDPLVEQARARVQDWADHYTGDREAAQILAQNTIGLLGWSSLGEGVHADPSIPHPSPVALARKQVAKQPANLQEYMLTRMAVSEDDTEPGHGERGDSPTGLSTPETTVDRLSETGETFTKDPFAVLARESRGMFNTYRNPDLTEAEKEKKLDSYFHKIESLDRMAFPSMDGKVVKGVPDGYIPDGFIDLGSDDSLDPSQRYDRSMNYVDTYNILHQHKAVFASVFANLNPDDFTGRDGAIRYQQIIMSNIALEIDKSMPYGEPTPVERGGIVEVSTAVPAMCQQHALTAQVLMQAFGIRSRLSKNLMADQRDLDERGLDFVGSDHVGNVVDIEGNVYMLDTTNPQYTESDGWAFGLFRMNKQLPDGSWLVTERNGTQRKYLERSNMYSTVQRPEAVDRSKKVESQFPRNREPGQDSEAVILQKPASSIRKAVRNGMLVRHDPSEGYYADPRYTYADDK